MTAKMTWLSMSRIKLKRLVTKRSTKFKKYIIFLLLLMLTLYMYLKFELYKLAYLEPLSMIHPKDLTGMNKLSVDLKEKLEKIELDLSLDDYEYDPRLMPLLTISKVGRLVEENQLDPKTFKIPFSWNDWLDLSSKLKMSRPWGLFHREELTCESFRNHFEIKHSFDVCQPLDENEWEEGLPRFKIVEPSDKFYQQDARAIMGASYLKHVAAPLERVILLGVSQDNAALIIPTMRDDKTLVLIPGARNQSAIESLEYLNYESTKRNAPISEIIDSGIRVSEQIEKLNSALTQAELDLKPTTDEYEIPRDILRLLKQDSNEGDSVKLTSRDLHFMDKLVQKRLKERLSLTGSDRYPQDFDYQLLEKLKELIPVAPNFDKYFHEAAIADRGTKGAHYDWRFFASLDRPYFEHVAILHRTIRAWLRFSNKAGAITWIAHGTMLSWYWNGLNMPWDTDADVQITVQSLYKLARNFNGSLVVDLTSEDEPEFGVASSKGIGKFFLDIGPSFVSRETGNGKNAIDARFIDTSTGLYIDITALGFSDFYKNKHLVGKKYQEFLRMLDPNFTNSTKTPISEEYNQYLLDVKRQVFLNQSAYNCRNNHYYTFDELSPLVPTLYEGVRAYVPNGFARILSREYRKGMTAKEFWGHKFMTRFRLWMKKDVCPTDKIGTTCRDAATLAEFALTKKYTLNHETEMGLIEKGEFAKYTDRDEYAPLRVDPWFVRHVKKVLGSLKR